MRITICGSMTFHAEMEQIAAELRAAGHEVRLPFLLFQVPGMRERTSLHEYVASVGGADFLDPDHVFWKIKGEAMDDHFSKISWSDAILVANYPKKGIEGYIGGNTLMELAVARHLGKRIYLLHAVSGQIGYKDEILGVGPCILNGSLEEIEVEASAKVPA